MSGTLGPNGPDPGARTTGPNGPDPVTVEIVEGTLG
jgi:hypothetical protein